MRIPHRPHVAVADNAAYHVSSVPRGCAAFEDIGDIEVACYGVGKVKGLETGFRVLAEETLVFPVKCMTELFKQDERVGIESRVLPGGDD